ncbi:MAG: acyltransferase [Bacteroidales bacterium]
MERALIEEIFNIEDKKAFRAAALKVFHLQAESVPLYREFLSALKLDPQLVKEVEEIPFLPVEFFKSHKIIREGMKPEVIFESSGTTRSTPSRHHVADTALYRESFTRGFRKFYGAPEDLCILALLPSYLERKRSSLVYMMDRLISSSQHPQSGFYLNNLKELSLILQKRKRDGDPTLLLGVSFALLDLAKAFPLKLTDHIIIMETGGMKGRRKEMVRVELHQTLIGAFGVKKIHSEYGMTELLSQAYSCGEGVFSCPPWMSVLVRDPDDPRTLLDDGNPGGINVIDLANVYSCSFIATSDLGRRYPDGTFEILGRFDQSDIRGCNLLVS